MGNMLSFLQVDVIDVKTVLLLLQRICPTSIYPAVDWRRKEGAEGRQIKMTEREGEGAAATITPTRHLSAPTPTPTPTTGAA